MKSHLRPIPALLVAAFLTTPDAEADWPQWRGPDRSGVAADSADLPEQLGEEYEPVKRWESIEVPSDHYGGHGSVSVADGKVYLSVVWHRDQPTETRRINREVLSALGYRSTNRLPDEVVEKMESDRMNLSRRLRGEALQEWAEDWVEENITDPKVRLSLGNWIISRFKKGRAAVPLDVYDTLQSVSDRTFAGQAEMEAWVEAQDFDPVIRDQIIRAVPHTKKVADDVVLCLDAETGEVVWEFEQEGRPTGRSSSSTPAVANGRVYAALSEHLYCLDAQTGERVWRTELSGRKGPASSPLVHGGRVYLQQNHLSAHDAETGEELWKNQDAGGSHPSPAVWKDVILCNSNKTLVGVDAESGATLWEAPGGGQGTPVVAGDHVVISCRTEGENILAYRLSESGPPQKLWSVGFLARRYSSSPVIHGDHVYYLGSSRHLCFDLKSGEKRWEHEAQSSISSPLVADGKLLVYENRGGYAQLIEATPEEYRAIGRAKVGALFCASPALVGSDLFLRTPEGVVCYRFQ